MKKNKKGFTLVELLAVIVILAVILVIAVPRISEVINNSKKASFEATAKTIASQAEKKYMENEVLGKTNSFECSDVAKINSTDYGTCKIIFDQSGNAKVSINGKGKFEGLKIVNATKDIANAVENKIEYTNPNCFVVNSQGVITDYKNPATALNIINDALFDKVYAAPSIGTTKTFDSDKCPRDVVIPEKINGVTITGIGHHAFAADDIYSIDIPITITSLEDGIFKYGEENYSVISNANFKTIYIHEESQRDLNWILFVYFNGETDSGASYDKETGIISGNYGDVKLELR